MMERRKSIVLGAGLLTIALVLSACGSQATPATAPAPLPAPQATPAPAVTPHPGTTPTAPPAPPAPAPAPAPATETGTVELRATDAPPKDISKIMVTTSNIEDHRAGNAEDEGWTTVVGDERTFDLLAIAGAEAFLGDKEVAAGKYTQIRLDVTRVVVTLQGNRGQASQWQAKGGEAMGGGGR